LAVVVEAAESSLDRDRTTNKRIYARAEIPLYLLVDLRSRRVFAWRPGREQPEIDSDADDVPVTIAVETGRIPVAALLP
jgi:Uma2 family endonuclease